MGVTVQMGSVSPLPSKRPQPWQRAVASRPRLLATCMLGLLATWLVASMLLSRNLESLSGPASTWQAGHHSMGLPGLGWLVPDVGRGTGTASVLHGVPCSQRAALRREAHQCLVMYIFAATDPEFMPNLRYFVAEAVEGDTRCDYAIVVQNYRDEEEASPVELPELPRNAKYVFHSNECYDWGTFGWLLTSGHVDIRRYKYFFFMNCSVRGPFLPSYARGRVHWTEPFLVRLRGDVKLVGPTISCEGSPLDGNMAGKWRRNPHVQSYVVATDKVGLQLLIDDGKVFQCHDSRWNTIYHSELGSSAAILAAGFNLDCLMARYQGVDWRDPANWDCNQRFSPQGENYVDGVTLDPLETMFSKVKSFSLMNSLSSARKAAKYQAWQHTPRQPDNATLITGNEYLEDPARFKVPRILEAKARGSDCFDFGFYAEKNQDLVPALNTTDVLWKHYVYFGQFEMRPHKFTCPFDYSRHILQ